MSSIQERILVKQRARMEALRQAEVPKEPEGAPSEATGANKAVVLIDPNEAEENEETHLEGGEVAAEEVAEPAVGGDGEAPIQQAAVPTAAEEVASKKAARKRRGKAVGTAPSEAPAKRARKDKGKEKEMIIIACYLKTT